MRSVPLQTWLLALGAAISLFGIGLAFYAESPGSAYYAALYAETYCGWFLMAGLAITFLGAAVWGIRTTVTNCLMGALGTAVAGCFILFFGRINIHGATAGLLYVVIAAAVATFFLVFIAVIRFLIKRLPSQHLKSPPGESPE